MIKRYDELNEGWKSDIITLGIGLMSLFSTIGQDTRKMEYDLDYFIKYAKTMSVVNTNQTVQMAIKDFKSKVASDSKILNKQEVYNRIDSTPIVYKKNDKFSNLLYQHAKRDNGDLYGWCYNNVFISDNKTMSIIFLSDDATYYTIIHELSHAIEPVIKVDPNILSLFNFRSSDERRSLILELITNSEYKLRRGSIKKEDIEYYNNPGEVYSRLNSLKMFLFKHGVLKSLSEEITGKIMVNLLTGELYKSLDDKSKLEFKDSDFLEILMFLNIEESKLDNIINKGGFNKYVQYGMKKNNIS